MDTCTPPKARIRVDAVTNQLDSKQRCLITNVDCDEVTEYAHVLGHGLEDNEDLMARLEFSWNKKYRAQSIHTHENIFRLSAKLHHLFDKNKWLLLPETRILDQYEMAHRKPHLFPTIEEETYRYRLVAHPDMKNVPIHRRDETRPISPNAFEKFVYPLEGFPTIVSHVHPRFAICNAALKFEDRETVYAFARGKEGELYNALAKVARIYDGWSRVDLPNNFRRERRVRKVHPRATIDREVKRDVTYSEQDIAPSGPATIAATSAFRSVRAYSITNETSGRGARESDLEKAKVRVDNVAAKRCLLENTDEANALDYAHLLDRGSSNETLTALEYSWGMNYMTLNVDSRYNMFRLSRTLHRLFNENAWLLIPEQAIINKYHAVMTERAKFPLLENHRPPYSYTLVANHLMEQVPIHVKRNQEDANDNEVNDMVDFNLEDAFACHTLPFHRFPVIKSHVHPRFVICNSGGKLKNFVYSTSRYNHFNPLHETALLHIKQIYESWTKEDIVPREFTAAGPLHQENTPFDFPDDKTEHRRLRSHTKRKRISSPLIGDVPSKPSKQAKSGGANDSVWLDDATLGELEPDQSPKKAWHDKLAWIQSWVGQVPMDATVEEDIEVVDNFACQTFDECVSDSDDMESLLSS